MRAGFEHFRRRRHTEYFRQCIGGFACTREALLGPSRIVAIRPLWITLAPYIVSSRVRWLSEAC